MFLLLRGNVLCQLVYLRIVNVDWCKPATEKYRLLLSVPLICFSSFYPSVLSFLFAFLSTAQSTPLCKKKDIYSVSSGYTLFCHMVRKWRFWCSALCFLQLFFFTPVVFLSQMLWQGCSVSDDAWRNWLSRKINCIATTGTSVFAFWKISLVFHFVNDRN